MVDAGTSTSKSLLGDRYSVVKELGHSGFGKTYLAEDLQGAGELCVAQAFLPQIKDRAVLEKAKDIFEREGRVLCQLSHRQIPEFRELIEVDAKSGPRLFLIQDYIQGQSYQDLLADRKRFNGRFNETELTSLLYEMLPVLSYIHSRGIIHRDISPENLVLQPIDGRTALINFGSVKEIAARAKGSLSAEGLETEPMRIGRVGYAPQEQLSGGQVDGTSDLYGLAATIMALATGEEPETLNDSAQGTWRGFDLLSSKLSNILARMLSVNVGDRFPSAKDVLMALRQEDAPSADTAGKNTAGKNTAGKSAVGGAAAIASATAEMYATPGTISVESSDILVGEGPEMAMASPGLSLIDAPLDIGQGMDRMDDVSETYDVPHESKIIGQPGWKEALIALGALIGFVLTALLLGSLIRGGQNDSARQSAQNGAAADTQLQSGESLLEETLRRREIDQRREQLGISDGFFTNLVNQQFYQAYPTLRTSGANNGLQPITSAPRDEPLRIRWEHIALNLLDTMEGNFNPRSLSKIGSYTEADRDTWRSQIQAVGIEPRSLYDLVDAKFFRLFPNQAGNDFLTQPIGQLYYALADGQAQTIADGGVREAVTFDSGEFSRAFDGQLNAGEGRLYTIDLSAGQLLRLNLNAPQDSSLISLYPPAPTDDRPAIFADSKQATWSGSLSETGDYELVVLNRSNQPIDYELTISVDNVTSAPVAPPREENTAADDASSEESTPAETDSEDGAVNVDRVEDVPGLGGDSNNQSGTSERN